MDMGSIGSNNYSGYAMNLKAQYTQMTMEGEFNINGQKMKGSLSVESLNIEFSMASFGLSSLSSGSQGGLNALSEFLNGGSKSSKTEEQIRGFLKGLDKGINGLTLDKIGYTGKPLAELSTDEASSLVSEEGFFGLRQTAKRIADFVIKGSGTDLERLKAGREGALKGFHEAEKMWGEKLPELSQKTIESALKQIDDRIKELGGHVLETQG